MRETFLFLLVVGLSLAVVPAYSQETENSSENQETTQSNDKVIDTKQLIVKDASVEEDFVHKKKIGRAKLYMVGDYISVASPSGGESLSGIGFSFQGQFALATRWGVNVSVRQNFNFAGTSIVTSFDGRLTWAMTGKLVSFDEETKVGTTAVAKKKDYDLSGFRLQFLATQYYFNASSTTVPYNGIGFAGYYEFTNRHRYNFITGIRMDQIANTSNENTFSATPMSIFFGVGIPF